MTRAASAEEVAQQIYRECVYKTGMPEPPSQWVFALDKCAAMLRTHADSAVAEAVKQVKDFLFKQASSFPKNANGDFVSEASWNQAQALTDAAIAIGKLTPVAVRLAAQQRIDAAVAEALKAAKEEAYKQSRESNDSAQVFICERIARRIDALTPANVRLASEERELVARIARCDELPHYQECQTLLATRDPYPPCNCWVGAHRATLTRQLADLRAKGGGK